MGVTFLCPHTAPLRPRPSAARIRNWLAEQGWRVGDVLDGQIILPTEEHATYINDLVAKKWPTDVFVPTVGFHDPKEV